MLQEGASAAGATRKAHEQLAHNLESLNAMVAFADEVTECRRVMLMRHFGEEFDPGQCGGACSLLCARMLWNRFAGFAALHVCSRQNLRTFSSWPLHTCEHHTSLTASWLTEAP